MRDPKMIGKCVVCGKLTKRIVEHGEFVCYEHGLMFRGFMMMQRLNASTEPQLWELFKKKCKEFKLDKPM